MKSNEYETLRGTVESAAKRFLPKVSSFMELEDLEQEGWIAATVAMTRFDVTKGVQLTTYVYGAIDMAFKALLKKTNKRRGEVSFDEPVNGGSESSNDEEASTLHDTMGVEARHEIDIENEEKVNALKARFPKHVMDVIYLRLEGLSYEEISTRLKVSVDAAKKSFSRVCNEMKEVAA